MNKFLILLFFIMSSCSMQSPTKGEKIGRIVRLSECGLFFKTYEGDLIRGGLSDGSGVIGQSFPFTIEDRNVYEDARKYFEDQSEVVIQYEKEFLSGCWRSECLNPSFIKKIKKQKKD